MVQRETVPYCGLGVVLCEAVSYTGEWVFLCDCTVLWTVWFCVSLYRTVDRGGSVLGCTVQWNVDVSL